MKVAQINTAEYNMFKYNLFKKVDSVANECPDCKKNTPLRELLKDTVEFSK